MKKIRRSEKLSQYVACWLERKKLAVKESTFSRYVGLIYTHILPDLGEMKLAKINEEIIKDYMAKKMKNGNLVNANHLSNKTVKDLLILLNQILKSAGVHIKMPSIKSENKDLTVLSTTEREKLIQYICNHINNITVGIMLSLFCGLRIGEVCALKWEDIHLEDKLISISGTLNRIKDFQKDKTKVIISKPKSAASKRTIPIPTDIVHIIKQVKGEDHSFLLTNRPKYLDSRTYYYKYKQILQILKMDKYNYHILRHTFATRCIELGFDPKALSEILGHASVKTTLSLYVHPSFELKAKYMDKLTLNS